MNRSTNIRSRVLRNLKRHGFKESDVEDDEIYDELNQAQESIISESNPDKTVFITLKEDVETYPLTTNTVTDPELTTYKNNTVSVKVVKQPEEFRYPFLIIPNEKFVELIDGPSPNWMGLFQYPGLVAGDLVVTGENMLGTKNSSNKIFQLPDLIVVDSEQIIYQGSVLTRDVDYTIVNSTITMVSITPGASETLTCNYIKHSILGASIINTHQPLIGTIIGGRLRVYPVPDSAYEDIQIELFVHLKGAVGTIDENTEPELDIEWDKALEYFCTAQFLSGDERQQFMNEFERERLRIRPLGSRKNGVISRPRIF